MIIEKLILNLYLITYKIILEGNLINRLDISDSLRYKINSNSREPIKIGIIKLKFFSKILNSTFLNKNSSANAIKKLNENN